MENNEISKYTPEERMVIGLGMIAKNIVWNQKNNCQKCKGTWRKNDFTLCECSMDAPYTSEEITGIIHNLL